MSAATRITTRAARPPVSRQPHHRNTSGYSGLNFTHASRHARREPAKRKAHREEDLRRVDRLPAAVARSTVSEARSPRVFRRRITVGPPLPREPQWVVAADVEVLRRRPDHSAYPFEPREMRLEGELAYPIKPTLTQRGGGCAWCSTSWRNGPPSFPATRFFCASAAVLPKHSALSATPRQRRVKIARAAVPALGTTRSNSALHHCRSLPVRIPRASPAPGAQSILTPRHGRLFVQGRRPLST